MSPIPPQQLSGLLENQPLASMTTLELGGPARHSVAVNDDGALIDAVRWAQHNDVPVAVLGSGSNVVAADTGYRGLVVGVATKGLEMRVDGETALVTVAAGERWDDVVATTVEEGLVGLECLSGIPGTAGATPIQNVGAYGAEVGDVLESVRLLNRRTLDVIEASPEELDLGYRSSRLRREPDRFVVLRVSFRLRTNGAVDIRYPELTRTLAAHKAGVGPNEVRTAVLELRRSKSMVIDPADPNRRSAGSFFKNPVLPQQEFIRLQARSRRIDDDDEVPRFPAGDGGVKVPAAWLIEHSGFEKGYTVGRVGISTRHSLALINRGGANADELIALARQIQAGVIKRYGVALEPEPVFLGFDTVNPIG